MTKRWSSIRSDQATTKRQANKATRKANKLLAQGDELASINPAESRKILRQCLRYRRKAKTATQ